MYRTMCFGFNVGCLAKLFTDADFGKPSFCLRCHLGHNVRVSQRFSVHRFFVDLQREIDLNPRWSDEVTGGQGQPLELTQNHAYDPSQP